MGEYGGPRLHIGKLTRNINVEHLKEIFSHFGKVTSAEVVMDRAVNLSKGFGFVEFVKRADAMNAIKHLDGSLLDGNTIPVAISQQPRRSPPPSFRYGTGAGGSRPHPPRGRSPFRRCAAASFASGTAQDS